jgi:hypothetical protein
MVLPYLVISTESGQKLGLQIVFTPGFRAICVQSVHGHVCFQLQPLSPYLRANRPNPVSSSGSGTSAPKLKSATGRWEVRRNAQSESLYNLVAECVMTPRPPMYQFSSQTLNIAKRALVCKCNRKFIKAALIRASQTGDGYQLRLNYMSVAPD